jgi:OmpA-OmpF porin, OOP family
MMRFKYRTTVLAACLGLVFLLGAGLASAETKMVPKVDNFILFADYSGSMSMPYAKTGDIKMVLEKKFLAKLNEKIPNLEYQAALFTYAPFDKLSPASGIAKYDRAAFKRGIDGLKTDYDTFGRLTPFGDSLTSLGATIDPMSKRLAIIILGDGERNQGVEPVAVAKGYYDKYPGNVCFHMVSFADEPVGQKTIDAIAALSPCSVKVDGPALLKDEAAFDKFVRDVFFDMQETKAMATPAKAEKMEEAITLRSVQFDLDKADIRKDMAPILDEAVAIIKAKKRPIQLDGHTCSLGTDEHNLKLSQRRADSVKAYLVKKGVDPMSISTKGYGESMPKFDNSKEESRKLNRRTEISFK